VGNEFVLQVLFVPLREPEQLKPGVQLTEQKCGTCHPESRRTDVNR